MGPSIEYSVKSIHCMMYTFLFQILYEAINRPKLLEECHMHVTPNSCIVVCRRNLLHHYP